MNSVDLGPAALWLPILAGLVSGLAAALMFRSLVDRAQLRRTVNRILAHVIELRLFLDEPVLVFQAQRDLLMENLRLLRLIALPCAILAIPFTLLVGQLHDFLGFAPLVVGAPAVVTVQLQREAGPTLRLQTPPWLAIETPAVHIPNSQRVSWRVRPLAAESGQIELKGAFGVMKVNIFSGPGLHRLAPRQPLAVSAIRWIEIPYPPATILRSSWVVWFSLATLLGGLLTTLTIGRKS